MLRLFCQYPQSIEDNQPCVKRSRLVNLPAVSRHVWMYTEIYFTIRGMASIWWIRRDLRLTDNLALQAALAQGQEVIPLFILDTRLLELAAPRRRAFLFEGLAKLDADLRQIGSRLVMQRGEPREVLRRVMAESGAQQIYASEDYSPYARRRDAWVAAELPLTLLPGVTILHPAAVAKPDGSPYTVFTPFSRAWKALAVTAVDLLPAPQRLPFPKRWDAKFSAQETQAWPSWGGEHGAALFPAGEAEALRRLEHFLSGPVYAYTEDRNRLDLQGTSALSPYLRFGMLSPRQALAAALAAGQSAQTAEARKGVETWISELIWREFYVSILYHFPFVLKTAFNPALRTIPWRDTAKEAFADLQVWKDGLTGYPAVDASMRQLRETGWMHNRGRMIVASFLAKDLLINWQEGERWFMGNLVDGDPAANNGGWQWTAGVGTDAAPYFRVFNPVLQGKKFDPSGAFIRRWLPELKQAPDEWIHTPWEMPLAVQRECGFRPGKDYPLPVVDHAFARQRALEAYRLAKQDQAGFSLS